MDPEDENGSSSQGQNLHDLQNYLSTFNKEIEPGDDVLANMDVDSGVGDVSELYSSNPDNPLQDSADGPVTSQFSSGFYSEQGILDTPLSEESTHQIQNMVGSVDTEADMAASIKQEVGSIDLENVQAHLAHFSHGIGEIHTSSIPQGLIMTSLSDSLDASAGKLIRIVSLGDDGQYLSIADSSQMQILSQDLGISTDALSMSDGTLGVVASAANIISSNSSILGSVGSSTMVVAGRNSMMTATSSSMTGTTQLVAIQSTSDNTQPHLVAIPQRSALTAEALQQMSGLLGTDRAELGYQTITILPTELNQNGDMNYVLIMAPQEVQKGDSQPLAQVVEGLKQETQELSEELVEINGEVKRVLRVIPKKYIAANFGAQLMCDYCDYTSPKRYLLTRHMKSHSDERPHKCKECDRGFKTPASLLNHSNTHTGTRPHKCKTCEAAFTTSGELVRHIRYRHTFEKPHRCPDCDYASVELSKLKRHMRSHTGERPYKCLHCPYASPDTYKLKRHLRIHTGEKPYECDICHARFTQSNSLKAHKLIHSGNKPVFQCGLCPTTCGRKTDLKIHFNKLHSMGSPLECKKCSQTFSDRYSYKQHVRGHDVDKNFKCDQCDFVANTERMFDLHAAVHSDGKKFDCDVCHSSFNLQQTLDKHKHSCQLGGESGMESQSPSSRDKEPTKEDGVFSLSSCNSTPVSSSQLVSAPLASDTLHKNLLQDIKSGKLGDVPQVVIVHPDGSLEEISSKGDRMNLEDIFSALAHSGKAESTHASREGTQAKGSNDRAGNSAAGTKKQKEPKPDLSEGEDDGDDDGEEEEEENEGPETVEASQCEASTQVELESDSGSVDDDDSQSVCSPTHFPQVVDKESQHIASTMRSESTEDNSASSNIETSSLHSHEASSDAMSSILQNVSSSTSSLFSTALPSVLHMPTDQAVAGSQQFVVVKGYTCLNNDGTQPTLVNVAVDKDSLMKMLASLANSGDSAMHLLTGDLESSVAISVDNSQTAILPLAQLQLNNFDCGLSSSLILGANFEGEDLNPTHDQDLLKRELISTDCDNANKNKECSASSENINLLDENSKDNKPLSDSSSKAGTSLLDSHVETDINLLESNSKRDTSLFNLDCKLDLGLSACAGSNNNNISNLASTTASTDATACVFPADTESKNCHPKICAPACTSSSLTLIKSNLSQGHFVDGSAASIDNQKTVTSSFCEGETISEIQDGSNSSDSGYPPAEPFHSVRGILGDFIGESQVPHMGNMEMSSQPPRSLPFEEWASSDAGSAYQGSLVSPLAVVFESSHFVAEISSTQDVPGTHLSTEVQDQQMPAHEKQKGSNKKRTATTDVNQSLVMTGKRVRKTLVKVSM